MQTSVLLANLGLGFLLGAAGQVLRAVSGMRKNAVSVAPVEGGTQFSWSQFGLSIFLGGVTGMVATLVLWEKLTEINKETALGLLAAGYSGSDFLEGLTRWLPKTNPSSPPTV